MLEHQIQFTGTKCIVSINNFGLFVPTIFNNFPFVAYPHFYNWCRASLTISVRGMYNQAGNARCDMFSNCFTVGDRPRLPFSVRDQKTWCISRKTWNRLLHSLLGNTATGHPAERIVVSKQIHYIVITVPSSAVFEHSTIVHCNEASSDDDMTQTIQCLQSQTDRLNRALRRAKSEANNIKQ